MKKCIFLNRSSKISKSGAILIAYIRHIDCPKIAVFDGSAL